MCSWPCFWFLCWWEEASGGACFHPPQSRAHKLNIRIQIYKDRKKEEKKRKKGKIKPSTRLLFVMEAVMKTISEKNNMNELSMCTYPFLFPFFSISSNQKYRRESNHGRRQKHHQPSFAPCCCCQRGVVLLFELPPPCLLPRTSATSRLVTAPWSPNTNIARST